MPYVSGSGIFNILSCKGNGKFLSAFLKKVLNGFTSLTNGFYTFKAIRDNTIEIQHTVLVLKNKISKERKKL